MKPMNNFIELFLLVICFWHVTSMTIKRSTITTKTEWKCTGPFSQMRPEDCIAPNTPGCFFDNILDAYKPCSMPCAKDSLLTFVGREDCKSKCPGYLENCSEIIVPEIIGGETTASPPSEKPLLSPTDGNTDLFYLLFLIIVPLIIGFIFFTYCCYWKPKKTEAQLPNNSQEVIAPVEDGSYCSVCETETSWAVTDLKGITCTGWTEHVDNETNHAREPPDVQLERTEDFLKIKWARSEGVEYNSYSPFYIRLKTIEDIPREFKILHKPAECEPGSHGFNLEPILRSMEEEHPRMEMDTSGVQMQQEEAAAANSHQGNQVELGEHHSSAGSLSVHENLDLVDGPSIPPLDIGHSSDPVQNPDHGEDEESETTPLMGLTETSLGVSAEAADQQEGSYEHETEGSSLEPQTGSREHMSDVSLESTNSEDDSCQQEAVNESHRELINAERIVREIKDIANQNPRNRDIQPQNPYD